MYLDLPVEVIGHVNIKDDLGKVLLDRENAVHPQNMSRIIARALSNESNFFVHRIAFGNGGTTTNPAFEITFKAPNDGQPPDIRTWDSRIYNETYSEIIDEGNSTLNVLLGTDPGSTSPNDITRSGGGAVPSGDPASVPHVSGPGVRSNELGLTSEVVITSVINPSEPLGQSAGNVVTNADSSFTFDEIGLYTFGGPGSDSNGIADVDVGNRNSLDDTGLLANTQYSFIIEVDGAGPKEIIFQVPLAGGTGANGAILYGDLAEALNTSDTSWGIGILGSVLPAGSSVFITDTTDNNFPTITGAQTFGFLRFASGTTGSTSSVIVSNGTDANSIDLFDSLATRGLNPPLGTSFVTPVDGQTAGLQNDPTNPLRERERLLTHIVFAPILKSANRTLTITYTLTISVARS